MCLAIPGKVVGIEKDTAVVDYRGISKSANISLVDCKVGDWILVHVGFAIQVIDESEARKSYNLLDLASERIEELGDPDG